jgi:hypothetical protein
MAILSKSFRFIGLLLWTYNRPRTELDSVTG